jgi:menaquinone-dependent protoporphyrinogen oxidase
MARCIIVYGTKEGHTALLADHIASVLREAGIEVDVAAASALTSTFTMDTYDAALVASSVHMGEYQGALKDFVRAQRDWLASHPSAFISVSLSALGTDAEERAQLEQYIVAFAHDTGWRPARVEHVAGALVFSQYPFFMRQVMKLIARREGLPTSGDHDYTDYARLADFSREFAAALQAPVS